MRRNRIRLTESQLHQVIKESVNRILYEGQGWTTFKNMNPWNSDNNYDDNYVKNWSLKDVNKDGLKNFINTGANSDDNDSYYSDNGYSTDNEYDYLGNKNHKINRGFTGKLGRAAGVAGSLGSMMARKAYLNMKDKFGRK